LEVEEAWKAQKKNFGRQPKVYRNIDECIKKLMSNNATLAEHSAKSIVKRSTSLVPGGVAFTHDPRLVYEKQLSISEEDTRELFKRINCPVLLFWTKGTLRKYRTPKKGDSAPDFQKNSKIVETLEDRMKCINFLLQVKVVEGSHHVHLDNPERIADDVLDLLIRPVAKL
jgi:pimeloyl-ACP methyl ester carboxylesterase